MVRQSIELPKLPEGFYAEAVDQKTYLDATEPLLPIVFARMGRLAPIEVSGERKEKQAQLAQQFAGGGAKLRLLVRREGTGEVVGWISGEQHDWETFYFRNSGFIPEVRRRGLYRTLHAAIIDHLRELGYERVISHHQPHNRAILILKLKVGYVVSQLVLDDRFGSLVQLVYFLNEDRRRRFEEKFDLLPGD